MCILYHNAICYANTMRTEGITTLNTVPSSIDVAPTVRFRSPNAIDKVILLSMKTSYPFLCFFLFVIRYFVSCFLPFLYPWFPGLKMDSTL